MIAVKFTDHIFKHKTSSTIGIVEEDETPAKKKRKVVDFIKPEEKVQLPSDVLMPLMDWGNNHEVTVRQAGSVRC